MEINSQSNSKEGVRQSIPDENSKSEQDKTKTATRKEGKSAVKVDGAMNVEDDDIVRLLSRYMSGIATAEEEEWVEEYLASSEENMMAFDAMCSAVEYQHEVDKKKVSGRNPFMRRRVLWIAMSVAAVALICFVVFSVIFAGSQGKGGENYVAENQNETTEPHSPEQGGGASAQDPQQNGTTAPEDEKEDEGGVDKGRPAGWQSHEEKQFAEEQEGGGFIVSRPDKKVLELDQNETTVEFSWEEKNVVKQTLLLKDKKGKVLKSQQLEGTYLKLNVGEYRSSGTVTWELEVEFKDGSRKQESGTINFK